MSGRAGKVGSSKMQWPADKVKRRKIADLIFDARNARIHSDDQIAQIAASITEWGWTIPILVDETGTIIAGHGRVLAAQLLGLDDVPTMCAKNWTDDQKRAYALADNKLALNAEWDDALLDTELAALDAADFDITLAGFDPSEDDDETDDDMEIKEVPTGEVADTFWISIRGPLRHQAEVLLRMKEATAKLGDVRVELGSVAIDG